MTSITIPQVLTGVACIWTLSINAQTQPAHEHGQAHLNLAQEGGFLLLELELPAEGLLGFEHYPTTEAEKSRLQEVVASLDDYRTVVNLLASKGELECEQSDSKVESPLLQAAPGAAGETEEHAGEMHSDFVVTYQLTCSDTPRGITAALISNYSGVAALHLQWVLDAAQGGATLTPAEPGVSF